MNDFLCHYYYLSLQIHILTTGSLRGHRLAVQSLHGDHGYGFVQAESM